MSEMWEIFSENHLEVGKINDIFLNPIQPDYAEFGNWELNFMWKSETQTYLCGTEFFMKGWLESGLV